MRGGPHRLGPRSRSETRCQRRQELVGNKLIDAIEPVRRRVGRHRPWSPRPRSGFEACPSEQEQAKSRALERASAAA